MPKTFREPVNLNEYGTPRYEGPSSHWIDRKWLIDRREKQKKVRVCKGAFVQTSEWEKGFICGAHFAGESNRGIANKLSRDPKTVNLIVRKYEQDGDTSRKAGSGSKRKTSPEDDKYLRIYVNRNNLRHHPRN